MAFLIPAASPPSPMEEKREESASVNAGVSPPNLPHAANNSSDAHASGEYLGDQVQLSEN